MSSSSAGLPAWVETPQEARARFIAELEFVQQLSNPGYLAHLAATRVLFAPEFIAYLRYLLYWKEPEYARFLIWPHCLEFLDLLQNEEFRTKLLMQPGKKKVVSLAVLMLMFDVKDFAANLTRQFEAFWKFHRLNQIKQ
jgi:hypothetical protein